MLRRGMTRGAPCTDTTRGIVGQSVTLWLRPFYGRVLPVRHASLARAVTVMREPVGKTHGAVLETSKRVCAAGAGGLTTGGWCGSYDNTWRLWNVETAQQLLVQEGHSKAACAPPPPPPRPTPLPPLSPGTSTPSPIICPRAPLCMVTRALRCHPRLFRARASACGMGHAARSGVRRCMPQCSARLRCMLHASCGSAGAACIFGSAFQCDNVQQATLQHGKRSCACSFGIAFQCDGALAATWYESYPLPYRSTIHRRTIPLPGSGRVGC